MWQASSTAKEPSRWCAITVARITPYLQTYKRARAELLLRDYVAVTPRNGRYTEELLAARTLFEELFFAIRIRAALAQEEPRGSFGHCRSNGHEGLPPRRA